METNFFKRKWEILSDIHQSIGLEVEGKDEASKEGWNKKFYF